jgi:hypothetical protein
MPGPEAALAAVAVRKAAERLPWPCVAMLAEVSRDCSRQATASPKRRYRPRSSPRLRVACAHELRSPSSSNTCVLWTSAMAASS